MKPNQPVIYWAATVLIAAAAATAAYFIGKGHADSVSDDIMDELEMLRQEQSDAAVVKRVSQQMEDIAYLQKTVSDQERDRAEQQSELAMAMRDRAEQESRIAREAQSKAMAAVKEAEQERAKALVHQEMAEEQRDAANRAKSISDTLNFRALGRTIGNTAITQYESGNTELAGKLAYASWYFLDTYCGNTYQPETFNALSICSDTRMGQQTLQKGTVRALCPIGDDGCIVVSDYGEMEIHRRTGTRRSVILQNHKYDFRDVWTDGSRIFALSHHGPLCETDDKKLIREIPLPEENYIRMLELQPGTFLLAAKHLLLEIDRNSGKFLKNKTLDKELVTLVKDAEGIILFFSDGTAARCSDGMVLSDFECTKGKNASAAFYDDNLTALFVGYANGDVDVFNRYGKWVCTIIGQTGRITDIVTLGSVMVSASFDKSVCIWNLPLLKLEGNKKLTDALDIPPGRLDIKHNVPSTEWASPVSISCPSWPLALCRLTRTEAAVGTAGGDVLRFNVSAEDMASVINKNQNIALTSEEWERYVSAAVQYIDME